MLLTWHQRLVRWKWRQTAVGPGRPPLLKGTVVLIQRLARANPTWGYVRIQGGQQRLKLVGRSALLLVAARPGDKAGRQITGGIDAAILAQLAHLSSKARDAGLRELLVLWLMDTVNIVTSYLSAPAALPLPVQAQAVVQRAAVISSLLDRLTDSLACGIKAEDVWENGLTLIRAAA